MSISRFRDLPGGTRTYIACVVGVGCLTVGHSLDQLFLNDIGWKWTLLALLTLVSGSATVNLPGLPATVSVSETFVFTSVLLFGPAAGTLTVALDALVISFWSYRKGHPQYKIPFNVAAVSAALWIASHIYFALSPYGPLYSKTSPVAISAIFWPLLGFAIIYYALNTGLISYAISLERQASPFRIWRENFIWISLNYFGGASVAALLVSYTRDLDYSFLIVIVPLLVVLYFTFSTSMGRVEDANRFLKELNSLYMSTIETLAMAIDAKDQITHGHIRRVQVYAVGLAKSMGVKEESQIRAIEAAALLHDMGKLAVPEYILNKPGPLTAAEFEKMKLHASVGADILSAIPFPYPVVPIVRHHHESWNGTGYPDKVSGTDIPIGARILAVVDCFDALTSDRPYRPRLADKEAVRILLERRGSMYDPLVVDTFIRIHATLAADVETQQSSSTSLQAIAEAVGPLPLSPESRSRFEEISASSDEMLTLFELARSLSTTMSGHDATDLIAKHLRRMVPSATCVFYMFDEEADELVASYASGEHSAFVKGLRVPRGVRLSGWVAANRLTIRNSDPVLDLGESARAMNPRPRSSLSTPLIVGDKLVGVLCLYSSNKDAYSEEHERIIEVVARQVSSAVVEAHTAERVRKISLKDESTGLPNLRHFVELAGAHLSDPNQRHPFCLIVIRLSGVARKSAPDGEELVNVVRRALRPADLLFSASPDELVALLLNTDQKAGTLIATRVTAALDALTPHGNAANISVGFACAPAEAAATEALLELARNRAGVPDLPPSSSNQAVH